VDDNPSGTDTLVGNSGQAGHTCDGGKGVAAIPWTSGAGQQRRVFPWQSNEGGAFRQHAETRAERLSDVDLAVEVASKEEDFDRAREKNYERVEKLATQGYRFRSFLDQEGCWYREVFGFLKGRNRVIALADYRAEKTFVLAVPHRFLIGQPDDMPVRSASSTPAPAARKRRPRDCPF
jgi:hypothetical protein